MDRPPQDYDGIALPVPTTEGRGLCKVSPNSLSCCAKLPVPRHDGSRRECLEKLESLLRFYQRRQWLGHVDAIKAAIRKVKK